MSFKVLTKYFLPEIFPLRFGWDMEGWSEAKLCEQHCYYYEQRVFRVFFFSVLSSSVWTVVTAVGFTVVWRSLSFIISDRLILCSYYWCVANNCIMGHSAQHHHQEQYCQLSTRPPQSHSIFLMRYLIFSLCVCWQTKHLIGRFLLLVQLQCLTGDTAGCSHIHAGEGENISRKLLLPLTC